MGRMLDALRRLEAKTEPAPPPVAPPANEAPPPPLQLPQPAIEPQGVEPQPAPPPAIELPPPEEQGALEPEVAMEPIDVEPLVIDAISPVDEEAIDPFIALAEPIAPLQLALLDAMEQTISAELRPAPTPPTPTEPVATPVSTRRRSDAGPYRTSRTDLNEICGRIQSQLAPGVPASVLLTSADARVNVTGVLIQIAEVLASRGDAVLLVDANPRRRELSRVLGDDRAPGLAETMQTGSVLPHYLHPTAFKGVSLLPAGMDRELVLEPTKVGRLAAAIRDLKQRFDFILIDAAQVQSLGVCELSRACDATYLIIGLGETGRWDAIGAVKHLQDGGGRATGAILA